MKVKIIFSNEQKKFKCGLKIRSLITKSVAKALEYLDFKYKCQVSVTFTDNAGIRELNRQYREKDSATDVLSFPMYDFKNGDVPFEGEDAELGDIVISLERANEQSEEFGHSFDREVSFLTVHSVLHLLGYDHETCEEDENEMFALQEKIMEKIGLKRN